MKKVLSALVLVSLLAVPVIGMAQVTQVTCPTYTTETTCTGAGCMWNPATSKCTGTSITKPSDLIDLINKLGNWTFAALLAVAAIFLVVAGFYFVTAGGNPEQTTKARQMLINALIGVAIALGAKGLVAVITNLIS